MPVRLIGEQCAFPGCRRPPHTASLCWVHAQAARPFDADDPVSVEVAVGRLIDRLAPARAREAEIDLDAWPVLSEFEADRLADLRDDARQSDENEEAA